MSVSPEDNLVLCVTGCLGKLHPKEMTKVGSVYVCAKCMADKTLCFSHCCDDEDCSCAKLCDEGDYCERHFLEQEAYWGAYFGVVRGDIEGNKRRLEAMKPLGAMTDEDHMEYEQAMRDAGRK